MFIGLNHTPLEQEKIEGLRLDITVLLSHTLNKRSYCLVFVSTFTYLFRLRFLVFNLNLVVQYGVHLSIFSSQIFLNIYFNLGILLLDVFDLYPHLDVILRVLMYFTLRFYCWADETTHIQTQFLGFDVLSSSCSVVLCHISKF